MKTDIPTDVLIFRTNIETEHDLNRVATLLEAQPLILKWTVDREDIDHVLRIESTGADEVVIRKSMEHAGFLCEDLVD